jgi:hypothetical protein
VARTAPAGVARPVYLPRHVQQPGSRPRGRRRRRDPSAHQRQPGAGGASRSPRPSTGRTAWRRSRTSARTSSPWTS